MGITLHPSDPLAMARAREAAFEAAVTVAHERYVAPWVPTVAAALRDLCGDAHARRIVDDMLVGAHRDCNDARLAAVSRFREVVISRCTARALDIPGAWRPFTYDPQPYWD